MKEPGEFLERSRSDLEPTARDTLDGTGILVDPGLVRVVHEKVIPHIMAGRVHGQPIRVWVPACATGEEAYSIAICLLEHLGEQGANTPIKIFATDIDDGLLATARAGVYPCDKLGENVPQRLLRFMTAFNGDCKVTPQVRESCVFARQDVWEHTPFSKLDLIRCPHVLSHFESSLRNKVFTNVYHALYVCGVLMLGGSLDFGDIGELFAIAGETRKFFVKNAAARIPDNGRRGAYRAVPDGRDIKRKIPTCSNLESESSVGTFDPAADQSDLERTRRYLRVVIGERQTALGELERIRQGPFAGIERLETVCEELESSNEELHSCNEELTTAKEELISSNKQLRSLNEDLEERNHELARLCDDLSNVLSALSIPIVILDSHRAIRRFTPPAQTLFGLLPADVGQPIAHFRLGIDASEFDRMILAVFETRSEMNRELQKNGRWYSVRVRPFRTGGDKIEGLLMAWFDIHGLKQTQQALQNDKKFVSAILDAAGDLLVIVLDREGRVAHFNRVCQQLTGYSLAEVHGRSMWNFLAIAQEAATLKADLQNPAFGKQRQTELEWVTKAGARQLIAWTFRPVLGEDGLVESVIATGTDQTRRVEAQLTAQESTSTLHALLETAAQAILAVNQEGRIVLANAATERMFGYGRQDLLGQPIEELIPHHLREKHAIHRAKWFMQPVSRAMGARRELTGLRADGVEFPIEVSLSYLRNRHGVLGVSFISDITERKKNEQTLLDYQLQLQRLAASLISAQETENRELARELHDVFSQELAALGMEISTILPTIKTHSSLAPQLAEVGKKIGRLAEEIHRTSRQLHPAVLNELGLETALQEECETLSEHSGMRVRLTSTNIPAALPEDVSLSLYRVAQESLYNIRKHAGATEVNVRLEGTAGGVSLQVADSGDGFDVEETRKRGGLGLISMEERVRLIGGKFSILSHAGNGTLVEVFVPLNLSET